MRPDKKVLRNEDQPPQGLSYLCAFIISVITAMAFPWMVGSAFDLNVEVVSLFFSSVFAAAAFSAIHVWNKKWLSAAVLIATPILVILSIMADLFLTRTGLETLMHAIQYYALFNLPGTYHRSPLGLEAITTILEAINIIHICITTYVVIRRKGIWIPLLLYAPYFFLAVANMAMVPSQASVILSISGSILLLFAHLMRNKARVVSEKCFLALIAPVFLITIIPGLIFPMRGYDKDKLAETALIELQASVEDLDKYTDGKLSRFLDVLIHGRNNDDQLEIESFQSSYSNLYATNTDLSTTGPFDPPAYKLFSVFKSRNSSYSGAADYYSGNYMYLKLNSMDIYQDNMWSMASINMDPYSHDYTPPAETAQYTITLIMSQEPDVDIVPMYTDFYVVQGTHDTYTQVNPYNYADEGRTVFYNSPVPVRTGNIYSEDYLDEYVYGTTLEVPESTRDALLDSGVLPDWFIEAYNGGSAMSDADKVRAVTEFVSTLHPYDKYTDYPPQDADFVVWFVTEADTGICVHYASTAVILLRMLGIPARFVDGFLNSAAGANRQGDVYSTDAHSWFEFFTPEFGWIMGDATPGNANAASHFDINAVSAAYPEIETDVFSVITMNNPVQTNTTDPTSDTEPSATDTSDPAGISDPTDSSDPTTTSDTVTTDPSNTTAPDATSDSTSQSQHDPTLPSSSVSTSDPTTPAGTEVDETEPSHLNDPRSSNGHRHRHRSSIPYTQLMDTAKAALIVFTGFALIRVIYVLSWKSRFAVKDNRKKAIAYYHYFSFTCKILGTKLPKKAVGVAQKAAFSNECVTDEEIKLLVSTCTESAKALSEKLPLYRRVPYRFFEITVRLTSCTRRKKTQ